MKKLLFGLLSSLIILFSSCNNGPNLQVVRKSSEFLHCQKIFAEHLDALHKENEILLQTGSTDSAKAAIIEVDDNEIILYHLKSYPANDGTTEEYAGSDYKLTLTYKENTNEHGTVIYKGKFVVEDKKSRREYQVEGWECNL